MTALKTWELVADVGTWMVIIGVAGEGLEILVKVIKRKWPSGKCAQWSHKREFLIDVVFGSAFWMMVVLGLGVEFRGNHRAKQIEDKENAALNLEAGAARKDAGAANDRAAKTELKVEELRKENLVLETELEKQMPRHLSDAQKEYAATLLSKYAGTPVLVRWIGQDADTDMFANSLNELLSGLGWKVSMESGWMLRGSGVAISPYKFADLNAAIALELFLNHCNVTAEYVGPQFMEQTRGKWSDNTNASVLLVIGYKGANVKFDFGPNHTFGTQF